MQLLGEDRQLAGLGAPQLAVDADDVAQVEVAGQRKALVADLLLADEQLDLAGPVLDVDEPQLARVALQDDAPRCADLRPRQLAGPLLLHPSAEIHGLRPVHVGQFDGLAACRSQLDFPAARSDVADVGSVVESSTPGVDSHVRDLAQFIAPGRLRGFPETLDLSGQVLSVTS